MHVVKHVIVTVLHHPLHYSFPSLSLSLRYNISNIIAISISFIKKALTLSLSMPNIFLHNSKHSLYAFVLSWVAATYNLPLLFPCASVVITLYYTLHQQDLTSLLQVAWLCR